MLYRYYAIVLKTWVVHFFHGVFQVLRPSNTMCDFLRSHKYATKDVLIAVQKSLARSKWKLALRWKCWKCTTQVHLNRKVHVIQDMCSIQNAVLVLWHAAIVLVHGLIIVETTHTKTKPLCRLYVPSHLGVKRRIAGLNCIKLWFVELVPWLTRW